MVLAIFSPNEGAGMVPGSGTSTAGSDLQHKALLAMSPTSAAPNSIPTTRRRSRFCISQTDFLVCPLGLRLGLSLPRHPVRAVPFHALCKEGMPLPSPGYSL